MVYMCKIFLVGCNNVGKYVVMVCVNKIRRVGCIQYFKKDVVNKYVSIFTSKWSKFNIKKSEKSILFRNGTFLLNKG